MRTPEGTSVQLIAAHTHQLQNIMGGQNELLICGNKNYCSDQPLMTHSSDYALITIFRIAHL